MGEIRKSASASAEANTVKTTELSNQASGEAAERGGQVNGRPGSPK